MDTLSIDPDRLRAELPELVSAAASVLPDDGWDEPELPAEAMPTQGLVPPPGPAPTLPVVPATPKQTLRSRLVPGKTPDHVDGLDDTFAERLNRMMEDAPEGVRGQLSILSGSRSNQRQAELFEEAVKKYGSPEAARKWVAPPGRSRHNHGTAVDLQYASDDAKAWVHANAARYGLRFPIVHEPWHIETSEARERVATPVAAKDFIEEAAFRTGVSARYLANLAKAESGFDPSASPDASSAKGLFQFTDGTWAQLIGESGLDYGLPANASVLDPRASAFMAAEYAKRNKRAMEGRLGRSITDGELYMGHFFDGPRAAEFIGAKEANPEAAAATLFQREAASNRTIFYAEDGRARTLSEVYGLLAAKVEGGEPVAASANSPLGRIDFTRTIAPTELIPPAPPPLVTEEEYEAIRMGHREETMGFWEAYGRSYADTTIIGRAYSMIGAPALRPDPTFRLDERNLAPLVEGLPEKYWDRFSDAVSAEHAAWIRSRALEEFEAQKAVEEMGWAGIGAEMLAGVTDAGAIAIGIATGGVAAGAATLARFGAVGARIAAAAGGAVGNVGTELALDVMGRPVEDRSLLFSAGVGALFGGAFGPIARNPATAQEAARIVHAARGLKQQLENSTALTPAPASAGAAANTSAIDPRLGDKAWTAVRDEDVAEAAMGSARLDVAGQVGSSPNPSARILGSSLFNNTVGNVDHRVNSMSADMETALLTKRWQTAWAQAREGAYRSWEKDLGYGVFRRPFHRREFSELVGDYIRTTDPLERAEFHPAVRQAGDAQAELNRRILGDLNNPLADRGLTGRPVAGYGDIPDDVHYLPRIPDAKKFNEALAAHGQRGVERFYAGAIRSAQPYIDEELLDKLSRGMVRNIYDRTWGVDDRLNMALAGRDEDFLRRFLAENAEFSEEEVERLMAGMARKPGGVDRHAKSRVLLDENFVLRGVNGYGTGDLSFKDLYVRDADFLFNSYSRHAAAKVALARQVIKSPTTGEVLQDGIVSDNEFERLLGIIRKRGIDEGIDLKQLDLDEKNLRWGYGRIRGNPDPATLNSGSDWLKAARGLQYLRLAGQFGFAQVGEIAATVTQVGLKATLQHLPAFRRLVNADGQWVLRHGLDREVEAIFGTGTDRLRGVHALTVDEYAGSPHALDRGRFVDKANAALDYGSSIVSDLSGMTAVNSALQRMAAKAIVQKFADLAAVPSKASLRRMAQLGLSEEMLGRILRQVEAHTGFADGALFGRKVRQLNLDTWQDMEARAAFELGVFRYSRKVIQENDVGSLHRWMSNPLMQTFLQFRTFMLTAWANQFLHNIHIRDWNAFAYFALSTLVGGLVYTVQTHLQALGRSDAEEWTRERLSPQSMALAAFQRNGWSSVIPSAVDSALFLTPRADPLFSFRNTGSASDAFLGSPVSGFVTDMRAAGAALVNPIAEGRDRTQQEYRALVRPLPLQNLMPFVQLYSTLVGGAPERKDGR
ncbi:D-alanyl-D-alanine carboxypeptidase family protein [Ancylobacter oerskovii]|uniref:D-alanyl-D-alanine carboxypeptidase family protein n=1 Tax=Ancylobacter oerskovii TaxID=459519 RepID=A0ABW4YUP7_9HYPH|nr:D-alanyl-D-alanine carboxypeptidase family protein [Ancylobacter oerskovii]